ncbi:glycosyltransferase family 2 protein [Ilumatobacter sp.]|uniref:glycosyltransferase family 2 protein n=1 Tax=Ilumatobacter sp. TaxID=1967498 RepID=UPI003C6EAC8B
MLRVTAAGAAVCDRIEDGSEVEASSLVDRLLDAGAIHPRGRAPASRHTIDDVTIVTPQLGGERKRDRDITVDDGSLPPIDGATVRLDVNRGPAAARNAGRREVGTALIAFVDADVTIDSDWLTLLLPHFDDPAVGLVAPRVIGDPTSSLDLGTEPARIRAGTRVGYVPAAAIVVRATAFDDVGGFDEALRFGEDVDFVWRLDQAGWRCRYAPRSTVHHEPRSTIGGRLRQQAGYGSAAAPLSLRHPNALAPFRANAWMATGWAAIVLGHPVVATVLGAANAVAVAKRLPEIPRGRIARLTVDGHVAGMRHFASAVRRIWWPIAFAMCLVSKRARWVTVAACAADIASVPTDVAYGWGVWRGMVDHRTVRPIVPEISRWEPERRPRRPARASG